MLNAPQSGRRKGKKEASRQGKRHIVYPSCPGQSLYSIRAGTLLRPGILAAGDFVWPPQIRLAGRAAPERTRRGEGQILALKLRKARLRRGLSFAK